MPKRKLLHIYGGIYHIMIRGNNRQNIFLDDEDRNQFLFLIEDGLKRFSHLLHGYCLMDNHAHLIIQVKDTPLDEIMHNLNLRYARFFNKKRDKVGHCFQGRYLPLAIHTGDYLLRLIRYVHLNPVKAGIVKDPSYHRWNSHNNYMNSTQTDWLTCDWVLYHFDSNKEIAIEKYQNFIFDNIRNKEDQQLLEEILKDQDSNLNSKLVRDSDYGKIDHRIHKASYESILSFTCKLLDLNKQELSSKISTSKYVEARAMITWLAKELKVSSIKKSAKYFDREVSSISKAKNKLVKFQINKLLKYKSCYLEEINQEKI